MVYTQGPPIRNGETAVTVLTILDDLPLTPIRCKRPRPLSPLPHTGLLSGEGAAVCDAAVDAQSLAEILEVAIENIRLRYLEAILPVGDSPCVVEQDRELHACLAASVRMLQAAACGNSSVGAHTVKAFLYRARALGLASVNFALPRERALGMKRALSWLRVCDSFTS